MTDKTHPTATIPRDEMKAWLDLFLAEDKFSAAKAKDMDYFYDKIDVMIPAIRDELSTPTIPAGMKSAEEWILEFPERTHENGKPFLLDLTDFIRAVQQDALSAVPTPPTSHGGWKSVPTAIPSAVIEVLKDYDLHKEKYPIYNQLWYAMLAVCPEPPKEGV